MEEGDSQTECVKLGLWTVLLVGREGVAPHVACTGAIRNATKLYCQKSKELRIKVCFFYLFNDAVSC